MLFEVSVNKNLFACREPEVDLGAGQRDLGDAFQMRRSLDVPAIVPAEPAGIKVSQQHDKRFDPTRVIERVEASVLRGLDVLEPVVAFQGVAIGANRTFHVV